MIKKHFVTCSVIMVIVFISALNLCAARVKRSAIQRTDISRFIFMRAEAVNNFSFANETLPVNNPRVQRKLEHSLLKHNYKNVQSNMLQNKAEKLFPVIEPILLAFGIPDDFKFIPLVESGFGAGTSSRGAKGLWQFMPGTARTYGLRVGHGIDERSNVRKSTIAACKYIKELYVEFNSWTLAAAAYNNGSVKLEKAINRQNEDNYFLMHLNRETGSYIYNLVAMKEIISQPGKYGYKNHFNLNYESLGSAELLAYN